MMVDSLRWEELRIEGRSWAGDETWFRIHPSGVAFDVGRGTLQLAGCSELFLTHGHLDHALGVPFVLSQRTLHRASETRVFCPPAVAAPLVDLVEAAARLEGVAYDYRVMPLHPGDRVEVGRDLMVEAFATDHVVPSLGYHLIRRKRRLAAAYREVRAEELVRLKRRGTEVETVSEELLLSYCGDTGPAVFDIEPRLFTTAVLVVECTFLAPGMEERGRRYKHLHLEDLVQYRGSFRNRAVVLHHLSRRHRAEALRQAVAERLPELAGRVFVLVGGRESSGYRS